MIGSSGGGLSMNEDGSLCDRLRWTPAPSVESKRVSQMVHRHDVLNGILGCDVWQCLRKFAKEPMIVSQIQQ